jgi:hypothetical protein
MAGQRPRGVDRSAAKRRIPTLTGQSKPRNPPFRGVTSGSVPRTAAIPLPNYTYDQTALILNARSPAGKFVAARTALGRTEPDRCTTPGRPEWSAGAIHEPSAMGATRRRSSRRATGSSADAGSSSTSSSGSSARARMSATRCRSPGERLASCRSAESCQRASESSTKSRSQFWYCRPTNSSMSPMRIQANASGCCGT